MKKPLLICLTLFLALLATAQEPKSKVLAIYYPSQKDHLVTLDGQSVYKFENTNDTQLQIQLVKIFKPKLSTTAYAITGQIKYDNVQGDGYLEMWNFFPPVHPGMPEGQYFSRTLGESGEMGKITGTCDWRDFSLPFDPTGASGPPTRLEINLILPGRGTVYVTPVKLVKYSAGFSPVSSSSSGFSNPTVAAGWWSANTNLWIAGIGAPLSACFGPILGVLASRGKARRLVLGLWRCCIAAGILCLIAALVAFKTGQPDDVRITLIVFGVVYTTIYSAIWPRAKKCYHEFEIRRMTSMDAAGG